MGHQKYVIIVAGGTGSRMNSDVPKQLIPVKGKPVIVYTIEKFLAYDKDIKLIIVSHKDYLQQIKQLTREFFPGREITFTEGGKTRFHSVKNGLEQIKESNGVVAIHDAARPMVSVKTIANCFALAEEKGNATPAIAVNESLRYADDKENKAVDRKLYRIIQTPQCFEISLIKNAFKQDYSERFTDDASVLESAGGQIFLAEGNPENIKITTPFDLKIAEAFLQ